MVTSPASAVGGSRGLAWAVLVTAVLEVLAPVVTINGPGASPGGGSGPELLITPVGWAFSIWGVIYTLAIVQAVAVLVAGHQVVPRRLQIAQVVLYAGGTLWIVLAGLDSSVATAMALALMLVAAIDGVRLATRHPITPSWLARLTRTSVGLYAGWVTAAFFLNLSTAMVDGGLVDADELTWQVGMLAAATASLLVVLVVAHGSLAYAAAGIWALVGIAVAGASDGTRAVTTASLISAALLVLVAAALQRSGGLAVSQATSPSPGGDPRVLPGHRDSS